ncbi:MAG: hypothetical protein SPK55_02030 [Succinivibrio sp.]|nr:hypothetical protein [Succinivibrio sp.]
MSLWESNNVINEFNFSKIIEAASDKKIPLSFALLMSITDSNTNTKDLVEMLCSYINSIKRFEHNEDAKAWCELESKIKLLKQTNELFKERYNQALNCHLRAQEKLMDYKKRETDKLLEIKKLQYQLKELKNRVNLENLLSTL